MKAKIHPTSIIQDNCEIGEGTEIGPFCLIKSDTIIGKNCKIDGYVKSSGSNRIGNNVTLRYNATIARGVEIEDNVFIAPNVSTVYRKGSRIIIKEGVFVGTGTIIDAGVTIAQRVKIGALSFVNKDCLESGVYVGSPVRKIK